MNWNGRPTGDVLIAAHESGRFARCPRCKNPIPSTAFVWHFGTEVFCAVCVPLSRFTTPNADLAKLEEVA